MSAAPASPPVSVHASAVVIGETGVLIRGASGSGKSSLADALILEAAQRGQFGRLIGDDRIRLACAGGRIMARPHPAIAGQIERRGIGIVSVPGEAAVVVRLVADILPDEAPQPARLPESPDASAAISGVVLPRVCLLAAHSVQEQARRIFNALGY